MSFELLIDAKSFGFTFYVCGILHAGEKAFCTRIGKSELVFVKMLHLSHRLPDVGFVSGNDFIRPFEGVVYLWFVGHLGDFRVDGSVVGISLLNVRELQ